MGSKRDSKFMPSASAKELLHTLVEEEEEEEEDTQCDRTITASPVEEVPAPSPEATITSPSVPPRHRPASLNLKPLSLVAATSVQAMNGDLPTPSPSPSPSAHSGLKSLALSPCSTLDASPSAPSEELSPAARRRHSFVFGSSSSPSVVPQRRPSLNISDIPAPPPSMPGPTRRSSIGYVCSSDPLFPAVNFGLPTPEITPVSERRQSNASVDSEFSRSSSRGSRPLSTIEQHFLFQAHQTLVQRISDLERALTARPRSRPQSYASDVSIPTEPPSDEMLQLIADLKAERDELKRDVDGWRTRLGDSEKQTSLLFKRVETERRDAWVARERAGLLEVEKHSLESTIKEKNAWGEQGWKKFRDAQSDFQKALEEVECLRPQAMKAMELEDEVAKLKAELEKERRKREEVEKELESVLATPTPRTFEFRPNSIKTAASRSGVFGKKGGLGFRSIDSTSSFTDVESLDGNYENQFPLKAVEEEDEAGIRDDVSDCSDGEYELSRYEDEDENDAYAFPDSFSTSSLGSLRDFQQSASPNTSADNVPPLSVCRSNASSPSPASTPEPTHGRHKSLSRAWTFPHETDVSPAIGREPDEVDRFFGCLEDIDNSPPSGCKLRSIESSKNLFSEALGADDDELPPFVIPSHVGVEVSPEFEPVPRTILDAVLEEDEEEECAPDGKMASFDDEIIGEEVEGGIIFTFSPPEDFQGYDEPRVPDVALTEEKSSGDLLGELDQSTSFSLSPDRLQKIASSPSSIPRLASTKSYPLAQPSPSTSTPVKPNSFKFPVVSDSPSVFVTPPFKRGTTPTFIPQPRSSSSSPFTSTCVKEPSASFIRQPQFGSAAASKIPYSSSSGPFSPTAKTSMSMYDVISPIPSRIYAKHICRHEDTITSRPPCPSPEMRSPTLSESTPASPIPVSDAVTSPSLRFMSPTLVTRLSIQKLTNFLPMPSLTSWTPRSPTFGDAATAAASALCIISSTSSSASDDTDSFQRILAAPVPKERGYVSKEQQLEKLRIRLQQEQQTRARITVCEPRCLQDGILHI